MDKPILFNTDMVRAILEDRKVQTRRVIKPQPEGEPCDWSEWRLPAGRKGIPGHFCFRMPNGGHCGISCPYGKSGDTLWVRETWGKDKHGIYHFRADYPEHDCEPYPIWHPSIHMPRSAARLFLRVKSVRAERVQDISEEDARAEGFNAYILFTHTWDSVYSKRGYGWEVNPWVWVVEFERVSQ